MQHPTLANLKPLAASHSNTIKDLGARWGTAFWAEIRVTTKLQSGKPMEKPWKIHGKTMDTINQNMDTI
jgi:hypothetical protein